MDNVKDGLSIGDVILLESQHKILRQFLKEQEWIDGPDLDQCPWCGAHEKYNKHNEDCYFADVDAKTKRKD